MDDGLLKAAANKHAGGNGRVPLDVVKCGGGAAILFGELEAAYASGKAVLFFLATPTPPVVAFGPG